MAADEFIAVAMKERILRQLSFSNAVLFSAGGNDALAEKVAKLLGLELHKLGGFFPDTDPKVKFGPNVRGKHVILFQPTVISGGRQDTDGPLASGRSASDNFMLMLGCCDAFKRASAQELTLVISSLGCAREDRKSRPHIPIMAGLVANLISYVSGADRAVIFDLHSGQIQGMFKPGFPVDNLYAMPILVDAALKYLEGEGVPRTLISLAAPDLGVKVLRSLGKLYQLPRVQVDKERVADEKTRMEAVVGEVKDRYIILIDDLFTTFGTMYDAVEAIYDLEAKIVIPCGVHPLIVGNAVQKMEASRAPLILTTDTVEWRSSNHRPDKVQIVSVAPKLAEALTEILTFGSVSRHFEGIDD